MSYFNKSHPNLDWEFIGKTDQIFKPNPIYLKNILIIDLIYLLFIEIKERTQPQKTAQGEADDRLFRLLKNSLFQ